MQKDGKTRIVLLLKDVVWFVSGQYLRQLFVLIHMVISNLSPDFFAFIMIMILAVSIACIKFKKE